MLSKLVLAGLVGLLATPAGTVDTSVLGCWDSVVELPWPAGAMTGDLCFTRDDAGALHGTMSMMNEARPLRGIKVGGGRLSFLVDAPVGEASIVANYEAKSMTGAMKTSAGDRPFRAVKQP